MHVWLGILVLNGLLSGEPTSVIGKPAPAFKLRDFRGAWHSLADLKEKPVVVVTFLGTECPLAKLYAGRLEELSQRFESKGVAFLGVNANEQDSLTEIASYARVHGLSFPILKDVGNAVADAFAAQRTPEVFVLDRERKIRYHGRIDDQYGIGFSRPKPTRNDLAAAIEELLSDRPVSVAETSAPGCHIGRAGKPQKEQTAAITYSNQIARIFQKRCVECHREGEIAPFSLTEYSEIAGWAATIREVVAERRMPPWHANPDYGSFANDAHLTDEEMEQLLAWVDAGAPEGDKSQLPPPINYVEGWRIAKPDLVVAMPDKYDVPAEGEVRYQYFAVDPGFTEDKWVSQAEARPGNRAVVHHIIVFVQPPGGALRAGVDLESDWLTAFAPGSRPLVLPNGMAKFIPKGSKLVFQMHYTPNGSPQTDQSSVGLVFADPKTVRKEVATDKAHNERFVIPAGAANHEVTAAKRFSHDTLLLALFPHMHLRGKSFRYEVKYPDGKSEILLDVPHYNFGWQNGYILSEPKRIPKNSTMICTAHYDNSEDNLSNPDPKQSVRWGDQTWEEMMIGYFDMALLDQDLVAHPPRSNLDRFKENLAAGKLVVSDELKALARESTKSDAAFDRICQVIREIAPQIHWVSAIKIEEDRLQIVRSMSVQRPLRRVVEQAAARSSAADFSLARFAKADQTIVISDLSKEQSADLKFFSRIFASATHVPVELNGKKILVSFWSRDKDAFPPELIKWLEEILLGLGK